MESPNDNFEIDVIYINYYAGTEYCERQKLFLFLLFHYRLYFLTIINSTAFVCNNRKYKDNELLNY